MNAHLPKMIWLALAMVWAAVPAEADSWIWSGGSATWSDASAVEWSEASGPGPAGQVVTFGSGHDGTVTIDRVTPAGILVTGGNYDFVGESAVSPGIVSSGGLVLSGESTRLALNLNNVQFSGNVVIQGGQLVLGAADALGTTGLRFQGGQLVYGSGVTTDLSSQLQAGSTAAVRIATNGNDVSWSQADGVKRTLTAGVEKAGDGQLSLEWVAGGETHRGHIQVAGGVLRISKVSGQGILAGGYSGSGVLELTSGPGQLTVNGDNSAFSGTLLLTGNGLPDRGSVSFESGAAMGGAETLVRVNGQRFWFGRSTTNTSRFEIVEGSSTYMDGSTGNRYIFSGDFSGSGELKLKPSSHITMSGDISAFSGRFVHPGNTAVSWILGGEGVAGNGLVQAELSSTGANMVYTFWYAAPVKMAGSLTGQARLRQRGSGVLTLSTQNSSTGNMEIDAGCEIRLGSPENAATWAGTSLAGAGQLTLVNGSLLNGMYSVAVSSVLAAEVAPSARVSGGGAAASALQRVSIAAGGQLTGFRGELAPSVMELEPGAANVGSSAGLAEGEQYMVELLEGRVMVAANSSVSIDMEAVADIVRGNRREVYLHISDSELVLGPGVTPGSLFADSATSPEALGLVVQGVSGGNIVLEGAVRDVYKVMDNGDYDTVTSYTRLAPYKATFIDAGFTLSLNLPGDNTQVAQVNNLLGPGNLHITNTDEASGLVRVVLQNETLTVDDGDLTPGQEQELMAANTELGGNITAGAAVQLVKSGPGRLTVDGVLTTPWLELDDGVLRLAGAGNVVGSLHGGAGLQLAQGSSLEISGDSLGYTGIIQGGGHLVVNGALPAPVRVGSLAGSGTLVSTGAPLLVMNLQDSTFSGTLTAGPRESVLSVGRGAGRFTLKTVTGSPAWRVRNEGVLTLELAADNSNAPLQLGGLEFAYASDTTVTLNTDWNVKVFSLGVLTVADSAVLTLVSTGTQKVLLNDDGTLVLGEVAAADLGEAARAEVKLEGATAFREVDSAWLSVEAGQLVLHTLANQRNRYAGLAQSPNAAAGASMTWNLPQNVLEKSAELSTLSQVLDQLAAVGNAAAGDSLLAAVAGAGTAVLAMEAMGDMERQLRSIRNRTASMGLNADLVYPDLPLFNAWVNAEGDYRQLEADGSASGYKVSSWGATVGCDIDFSKRVTAGFAFTYMRGDLDGRSSDSLSGEVNHYYLSLFGRYVHHRWTHTLVGAMGVSDAEIKRHVRYGMGGYNTTARTDGLSYGLLYEIGYVIPLDDDQRSCLQPVANISYRHAGYSGFSEHGSSAGLHVGSQSMDMVSFGLGARVQTYALENLYNRTSLLEARALLKLDAGDHRNHADVALLADRSRLGRVQSARQGAFGVELGAGITIPLGADAGQLFLDASVEIRADETELNGTVGYRMNF